MANSCENVYFDGAFIVGSGPLGCTYARMLAHPKSRITNQEKAAIPVIMIDIGAQLSRIPGEHLKNTVYFQRDVNKFTGVIDGHLLQTSVALDKSVVPTLDPDAFSYDPKEFRRFVQHGQNPKQESYYNLPAQASTYAVGGMATHWTACTPREHPTIERFQLFPDDLAKDEEEWDRLYNKAEQFVHTDSHVFDKSIRHKIVKSVLLETFSHEIKEHQYWPQSLPLGVKPPTPENQYVTWSGSNTVLGPLLEVAHASQEIFRLLPEWQAWKVGLSADKKSVEFIEIENLRNGKKYRVYSRIFILACNATLTPQLLHKSGIRPDALGKYICAQPLAFCQIVLKKSLLDEFKTYEESKKYKDERDDDPIPIPMSDPPPQCWIPVSEGREWHCQIHRDAFSYGGIAPNVDTRLIVDLRWFGKVTPVETNEITFSNGSQDKNVDSFGMPQPSYHFKMTTEDADRNHRMMGDMLKAANALGGFLPGANPSFQDPGLSLHLTGSTRMGHDKDRKTSVVNTYCQVWGINNLYLGTCGVIPTGTACNPTLTAMALAIRGAESIVEKWPDQFPLPEKALKYAPFNPSIQPVF